MRLVGAGSIGTDFAADDSEDLAEEAGSDREGLPDVLAGQFALVGLVEPDIPSVLVVGSIGLSGRRDRFPCPGGDPAVRGPLA